MERFLLYDALEKKKKRERPIHRLREAATDFLKYVDATWSESTYELYNFTLQKILREWGNREITMISTRDIEMYKANRSQVATPNTVSIELRVIKAFLNKLQEWKLISDNPAKGVRPPKKPEITPAFLNKEEFSRLLTSLKSQGNPYHDILLFAGLTGVRKGELIHLTWKDIDFQKRTIAIVNRPGFTTKTGRSRVIPMHPLVYEMLQKRDQTTEWVFPGDRGGKYFPNFLSSRFKKIIREHNLDDRLHFHSLRHSCASMLVIDGVSLYHVQRILGHTTPRITQTYAHLGGSDLMDAMNRLNIPYNQTEL
jgi:integrase